MGINIKIGEKPKATTKVALEIRKTLDGDIMIFDHEDIDIIIMPKKNKVLTYSKDIMADKIYATQNRLFKYLTRKGIVDPSSIKVGNVYSSLEAKILPSNEINSIDMMLLNIGRWIEEERPYFLYMRAADEQEKKRLLKPDDKDSTELGEVPQAEKKGSLKQSDFSFGVRRY